MRTRKLNPLPLPGNRGVTGVGKTIAPSGGDPFEETADVNEWEIMDDLDASDVENGNDVISGESDGEKEEVIDKELTDLDIEALLEEALPGKEEKTAGDNKEYTNRVRFELKGSV